MEKEKYLIYKITNKINGKIYIGLHKTSNIDDSYMGSGVDLIKDIKLIGIESFKKDILYIYDDPKDMLNKEAEIVNEAFIKRADTYNIMRGGGFLCGELCKGTAVVKDKEGNNFRIKLDDEKYISKEVIPCTTGLVSVKDKNSNNLKVKINDERYLSGELIPTWKGKLHTTETKNNMKGTNNPFYGKKHTEETKKKISNINKQNIGEKNPFYGKKHTEETKNKLSNIGKLIQKGEKNGFYGKKHTEETKKKISEIDRSGEKNSQYGTCWIHNTGLCVNKKIKKEDMDYWLNNGWNKGMKKQYFKK